MRLTKNQAQKEILAAVNVPGLQVVSFRWLGKWSPYKTGDDGHFRVASVILSAPGYKTTQKTFTASTIDEWTLR